MRILLDMDGVVVDLMTPWLEERHRLYGGEKYRIEQITAYDWTNELGIDKEQAYAIICRPNFYSGLKPFPGAIEGVKALCGFSEVVICTSPVNSLTCAGEKTEWVKWHLPWVRSIVITETKDLIKGDVMIDDRPENLAGFEGIRILFDRPWNRSEESLECLSGLVYDRVANWDEVVGKAGDLRREELTANRLYEEESLPGARPENPDRVFSQYPGKVEFVKDRSLLQSDANYLSLRKVLDLAYKRSSSGKGKERHADNNPFEQQPICTELRTMHDTAPAVYQIRKKALESLRLQPETAIRELLDVMVYAAAAVIYLQEVPNGG